jgi:hypothetical protein
MNDGQVKLLHWPGMQAFKVRMGLALFFLFFFYLVYGTAAYVADYVPWRIPVGFDFELTIPFIPESALIYLSLSLLMLLALFVIRETSQLKMLVYVLCIQTLIAGVCFVVFPAVSNFPARITGEGVLIFRIADTLNLHNNEVPSLHVCFAFTLVAVVSHYGLFWQRLMLYSWSVAIAVSALTIHEHNLIDLLAGIILSLWGLRYWRCLSAGDCISLGGGILTLGKGREAEP